ncbi:hypothetical protein CDAR_62541 [Caerostris darwini]|uniref:Uncharacterized protein n=1 Tax=Caerostris darwini TaxID=1538125 RepID=A0AAV4UF69_9ARAC|nr:hypothetical protein CDAR_62541 [Caerostris darwini]
MLKMLMASRKQIVKSSMPAPHRIFQPRIHHLSSQESFFYGPVASRHGALLTIPNSSMTTECFSEISQSLVGLCRVPAAFIFIAKKTDEMISTIVGGGFEEF